MSSFLYHTQSVSLAQCELKLVIVVLIASTFSRRDSPIADVASGSFKCHFGVLL